MDKIPTCELENELFKSIYEKTPDYYKNLKIIDMDNPNEFSFTITRENLYPYDVEKNPTGLNLIEWFANYSKEAKVSTAGIRGPQNILYPSDTRFPINLVGIILATLAKALVLKEKYQDKEIIKLAASEVRYNSQLYIDAITRIQAAAGIKTLTTKDRKTIPIWLASFLAFKLDLVGGEYITSSHGISVKTATKDLNSQGSQFLPEESMEFVHKIEEIFEEIDKNGFYTIKLSSKNDELIDDSVMEKINDGIDLYVEYLKSGVAENLSELKQMHNNIVIEAVGGCAYRTLSKVLEKLEISDHYVWNNTEEDPFFHSIGKYDVDPKGNKTFYDYSVDATVVAKRKNGDNFFPVIETLNYDRILENCPLGTAVLITDPDHDRLTICQIETDGNIPALKEAGISYIDLKNGKVLTVFSANQAFLMLMDFRMRQLKSNGKWHNYPRFMIKTTASALSWDQWAQHNNINVVNVPVGFKEIANIMKKVERQLKLGKEVIIDDVFGNSINLGVEPRLIFAGEESGGMIMGSEDLVQSLTGRKAIAMREKSATEAIIVASSLIAKLEKENKTLSQYLVDVFESNNISSMFDTRVDIAYYNESEPDIEKLKESKVIGEKQRTKNDLFFLSLAIAIRENVISIDEARDVLQDSFQDLDFSNLQSIKFVGDGTYLKFEDKYIEIRPSGTDAKTKAYGGGLSLKNISEFASVLGNYSGDRTEKHLALISEEFYNKSKETALNYYQKFVEKDANNEVFIIPDYNL